MSAVVAVVRPADWEGPLFLHVLGAMVLVGGLIIVVTALALAVRRDGSVQPLTRIAFRSAFLAVVPGFVLMRIAGQWLLSREYGDADEPGWVGFGYVAADLGLPLLLGVVVLAWLAARRGEAPGRLAPAGAIVGAVLLLAYLVAVWAMTTKPE